MGNMLISIKNEKKKKISDINKTDFTSVLMSPKINNDFCVGYSVRC